MDEMKAITLYTESGATLRFEQCWGYVEDLEVGDVTFSYKEGGVNFFATFKLDGLLGIAQEV